MDKCISLGQYKSMNLGRKCQNLSYFYIEFPILTDIPPNFEKPSFPFRQKCMFFNSVKNNVFLKTLLRHTAKLKMTISLTQKVFLIHKRVIYPPVPNCAEGIRKRAVEKQKIINGVVGNLHGKQYKIQWRAELLENGGAQTKPKQNWIEGWVNPEAPTMVGGRRARKF